MGAGHTMKVNDALNVLFIYDFPESVFERTIGIIIGILSIGFAQNYSICAGGPGEQDGNGSGYSLSFFRSFISEMNDWVRSCYENG